MSFYINIISALSIVQDIKSYSNLIMNELNKPIYILLTALVAYAAGRLKTRYDSIIGVRKDFLSKRFEAHTEFLRIVLRIKKIKNILGDNVGFYFFEDANGMLGAFLEISNFGYSNKALLSKNCFYNWIIINNIYKLLSEKIKNENNKDFFAKSIGTKYHNDFVDILRKLEESIASFFEKDLKLDYKYPSTSEKEEKEIEDYIRSLTFFKELKLKI